MQDIGFFFIAGLLLYGFIEMGNQTFIALFAIGIPMFWLGFICGNLHQGKQKMKIQQGISRTVFVIVVGMLLFSFVLVAQASDDYKGYVGIGLGSGEIDRVVDPISGFDIDQDKDGSTFRVFGGRQINDSFAIEGGWINFGDYGADITGLLFGVPVIETIDIDAEAFFINAVVSMPVDDYIGFYVKGGMYKWTVDVDDLLIGLPDPISDSYSLDGNDLFFGVGAMFTREPVSVRLGYDLYQNLGDDKDVDGEDLEVLSIDFMLRF